MLAYKPLLASQRRVAACSFRQATRSVLGRPCRASQKEAQTDNSTCPAATGPLALALLNLAAASPSFAEDVIAIGAPDKPVFALSPPEVALVLTPLVGYAIYNYARIKNPQLNFNDLLLIIAAVFLFGNIISIVVFKTSFY